MSVSNYQLAPALTISDCPSEVFCARFSPDGKMIAAGCGDGAIRVFNADSGRQCYTLNSIGDGLPCTGIRFRPVTNASKTKNVLLAVSTYQRLIDYTAYTSPFS
jgi:WD40 repeat protein